MHNTTSVLETETQKDLRDYEIQTDHRILTKQQDLEIVN